MAMRVTSRRRVDSLTLLYLQYSMNVSMLSASSQLTDGHGGLRFF